MQYILMTCNITIGIRCSILILLPGPFLELSVMPPSIFFNIWPHYPAILPQTSRIVHSYRNLIERQFVTQHFFRCQIEWSISHRRGVSALPLFCQMIPPPRPILIEVMAAMREGLLHPYKEQWPKFWAVTRIASRSF